MKFQYITLVSILLLAGCVKKSEPTAIQPELVNKDVKSLPYYPEAAPRQLAEEIVFDMVDVVLDVRFDWQKQKLEGVADLLVSPHFYSQEEIVLDARGFDIHEVKVNDRSASFEYDSLKIKVQLGNSVSRSDSVLIHIAYTAKPNELPTGGGRAITEDKGLYFINPLGEEDKPQQIWTQGEPEANSCWIPVIDAPNQKIKQEFRITVDTSYSTLSNGELKTSVTNPDGTRTDTWVQTKPHAPYLMMMAVGDFAIVKDEGPIDIAYYVEPAFKDHALAVFGNTPEMVSFFSETLGVQYPWDKYSQVVVRDFVSGAMENTSAAVFMEQLQITKRETLDKNWDYIIAHELFHHWFGDLVTCESWSNLALNESFANYSEYLWLDHKYGTDEAELHRVEELQGYLGEARRKRVPIIRYNYHQPDDMFDAHSYNKGGLVLHMLRKHLGDEAFFLSLKDYLTENAYSSAEVHDLRMSFEKVSGKDLTWFFNDWFLSPGHPELKTKTRMIGADSLEVSIYQTQDSIYSPTFEFPIQIGMYSGSNVQVKTEWIDKRAHSFRYPIEDSNTICLVNPNGVVPSEMAPITLEEALSLEVASLPFFTKLRMAKSLLSYSEEYYVIQNIDEKKRNEKANQFLARLAERLPVIKSQLKELMAEESTELKKLSLNASAYLKDSSVTEDALKLFQNSPASKVRSAAIEFLGQIDTTGVLFEESYRVGIKDSSYMVVAASLSSYLKSADESAEELLLGLESSNNIKIIQGLLTYYSEEVFLEKATWANEKYLSVSPISKIRMAKEYAEFLNQTDSLSRSEIADKLKVRGVNETHLYDRFSAYKVLFYMEGLPELDALRRDIIRNETNPTLIDAYKRWEKKRE